MSVRLTLLLLALRIIVSGEINSSSDLNCDFSSQCLWRNGTNGVEDSAEFAPGTNLKMDEYHKVTALRSDRDDPFVYSSAFAGRQTAVLISDVINCQLGGAALRYWYWKTGQSVLLDVCIRQPPGSREPSNTKCFDGLASTYAQQWIYRSIELPPISQPFEVLFRSTFTAPMEIIALDDIFYDAILCASYTSGASEGAGGAFAGSSGDFGEPRGWQPNFAVSTDEARNLFPAKKTYLAAPNFAASLDPPKYRASFDDTHFGYSKAAASKLFGISNSAVNPPSASHVVSGPRTGAAFQPRCPPIDCTFDQESFCEYVTAVSDSDLVGVAEGAREWKLSNHRIENTLTGILKDIGGHGAFAYAGGVDDPTQTFVLSSRTPLSLPASSRLDFFVHIAGVAGRLRVCFDTIQQCPFEVSHRQIGLQARQWNNFFVTVPDGSHTIHFVVDGLRKNYAIGLDNIQLLSKYGMSAQPC